MWEMSLEEKEEEETWERTRWTWENKSWDIYNGQMVGQRARDSHGQEQAMAYQTVFDARETDQLPHIVTDHEHEEVTSEMEKVFRREEDGKSGNALSSLDLLDHVNIKHKEDIPTQLDTSASETDDEMEDYYENHKDWPERSS